MSSAWGWLSNSSFHSARVTRGSERAPRIVELNEVARWPETYHQLHADDDSSDSDCSVVSRGSKSSRASARSSGGSKGKKNGSNNKSKNAAAAAAKSEVIAEAVEESKNESDMHDVVESDPASAAATASSVAASSSSSFLAAPVAVPLPSNVADLPEDATARFALYQRAYFPNAAFNSKIRLYRGDITKLRVDAVVNAANSGLHGGGGICGAIFDAAGEWKLAAACKRIRNEAGSCPPGETRLTRGFGLPAPFILHTVGPMDGDELDLINAYRSALDMAVQPVLLDQKPTEEIKIRSIALCCISTGIYGFPNEDAAEVALRSTREWLEEDPANAAAIDTIVFCVFLAKDLNLYQDMLPTFFPVGKEEIEAVERQKEEKAVAEAAAEEEKKLQEQNQKQKKGGSPQKTSRSSASAASSPASSKGAAAAASASGVRSPSSAASARIPLPASSASPPAVTTAVVAAAGQISPSPRAGVAQSSVDSSSARVAVAAAASPTLTSPPPPQLKKRKSEEEAEKKVEQVKQSPKQSASSDSRNQPVPASAAKAKAVAAAQARATFFHPKQLANSSAAAAAAPRPLSSSSNSFHPSHSSHRASIDAVMTVAPEQESKQQQPVVNRSSQPRTHVFALSDGEEDEQEEQIFMDAKEMPKSTSVMSEAKQTKTEIKQMTQPTHQAKKTKQ